MLGLPNRGIRIQTCPRKSHLFSQERLLRPGRARERSFRDFLRLLPAKENRLMQPADRARWKAARTMFLAMILSEVIDDGLGQAEALRT